MNISHPHYFIYWAVPYTGCDIIYTALSRHYGLTGEKQADDSFKMSREIGIPEDCQNYISIASMRNPYDRFVAYWKDIKRQVVSGNTSNVNPEMISFLKDKPNDFAHFARLALKDLSCGPLPMAVFLNGYYPGFWLRYEHLDLDFASLPWVRNEMSPGRICVGLRSNSEHWKKLYKNDPATRKFVFNFYRVDFENYGYFSEVG